GTIQGGLKTGQNVPTNYSVIRDISYRNQWQLRAEAFDREQIRIRTVLALEEYEARTKINLQSLGESGDIIATALTDIIQHGGGPNVRFPELVGALERVIKLNRLIVGQPTEETHMNVIVETPESRRLDRLHYSANVVSSFMNRWRGQRSETVTQAEV